MSRARLRRRHVTGALPAACLLGPWAWLGAPGVPVAGLVLAGLAVLCYPVAALCSPGFPACLVPRQSRANWRHRRDYAACKGGTVPGWLHRIVIIAYLGRCAARRLGGCAGGPEVDHKIPRAVGGLGWFPNLAVLCNRHNAIASDYWVSKDGWVNYHPWPGYRDEQLAARIRAVERWRACNPLRWVLAALALR